MFVFAYSIKLIFVRTNKNLCCMSLRQKMDLDISFSLVFPLQAIKKREHVMTCFNLNVKWRANNMFKHVKICYFNVEDHDKNMAIILRK